MNPLELEDFIRQGLDDSYWRRGNNVSGIKLSDIIGKKNPYLIRAVGTQRASEIVVELLKIYLASFDEGIFGQTVWEEWAEYPDFYQKLIPLMAQKPTQRRIDYEIALANAQNRFEHDFLINFGNDDGSIDWEKLLRYNSGKDRVVWVSKVVLASSAEDEEQDEDDTSDE